MRINWKKTIILLLDLILGVYLVFAFTKFNKPDESALVCNHVNITIQDEMTNGFLDAKEIQKRLEQRKLYPYKKKLKDVNVREIEETLKESPFVKTVECYKTQGGDVNIFLTQRTPLIRIKSDNGEDYYVDDHYQVMPNTRYTSDLIIATGHIRKPYAQAYLSLLSKALMSNDLWKYQIEQINVLPNLGIEMVPRVGNHIIYIGKLPQSNSQKRREAEICDFVEKKMDRLEKFYKYGLSQTGWNKYSYINLEFDNQIICKKYSEFVTASENEQAAQQTANQQTTSESPTSNGTESPSTTSEQKEEKKKTADGNNKKEGQKEQSSSKKKESNNSPKKETSKSKDKKSAEVKSTKETTTSKTSKKEETKKKEDKKTVAKEKKSSDKKTNKTKDSSNSSDKGKKSKSSNKKG